MRKMSINDELYGLLGEQGYRGSINDRMYQRVKDNPYEELEGILTDASSLPVTTATGTQSIEEAMGRRVTSFSSVKDMLAADQSLLSVGDRFTVGGSEYEWDGSSINPVGYFARDLQTSESVVDIVLVYGQSNARGYAANSEGDLSYASPLVRVWDGSSTIPLTSYTPTQNDSTSTGSAWKAFGNEYAKRTGRRAIIANCAKGSQSLQDLSKGEANTNYSGLVSWHDDIVSYIESEGDTVGEVFVVFHQGERDSQLATTSSDYQTLFLQLWDDIKADTSATNIFLCIVGTYTSGDQKVSAFAIQSAQMTLGQDSDDIRICWDGMPKMGDFKVDSVHLTQTGYNYMGLKCAENIVEMLFGDNLSASSALVANKGVPLVDPGQLWKHYGGWFTKGSTEWEVSNDGARASSNVVSISDAGDHLLVTFSDQFDYILEASCFGLVRDGRPTLRGEFGFYIYQDVDSEGRSTAKLYLKADIYGRADLSTQSFDTDLTASSLSSMFSTTWGTGSVVITHPECAAGAVANQRDSGNDPAIINCRPFPEDTTIRSYDATDPSSRLATEVGILWPGMVVTPSAVPTGTEIMVRVVAAKKRSF